jgi:localization factor PodJL
MKFNVPWRAKGIRPDARETAKEAARRSGLPLGDWLNVVILKQATHQGLQEQAPGEDDFYGEDLASVQERLDDLTRRVEQMSRKGPEACAPRRRRHSEGSGTDLVGRFDRRLEQFANASHPPPLSPAPTPNVQLPPGLDRAVAEIAARQRALNGASPQPPQQPRQQARQPQPQPQQQAPMAEPHGQPQHQPPRQPPMAQPVVTPPPQAAAPEHAPPPIPAPLPAQDLSGLEDQLRHLTDQIETLRMPGVREAITALRSELMEIGNALNDATPRREIETIEKQIAELSQRIAQGRQNGVDHDALAGIEHGLAEVRDALHCLTPAEQLVGFHEAIDGLAHKIDMIVAQKDPETMAQLQSAVTTLREMATHVASSEAVNALAAEVQTLGEKVDYIAHATIDNDALNHLDQRIGALVDTLAERQQNGAAGPPQLEALVQSLSDKIEKIQSSRGDDVAMGHLEDRIVSLVEKLDASESRLGQIEAIERGLSDLLVHIEEMRSDKAASAQGAEPSPAVDELKQDIARTQDAVDSVHGTLVLVVDRLAKIETDLRPEGEQRGAAEQAAQEAQAAQAEWAAQTARAQEGEQAEPAVDWPAVPVASDAPPEPPLPEPEPQRLPQAARLAMPEPPPAPESQSAPEPEPLQLHESQIAPAERPAAQPPAPEPPPPSQRAQPEPPPAPQRRRVASYVPINPDLPPDQPLEPGSGPPKFSDRIAASEAALGAAAPPEQGTAGGQSSFIAAARRAARAALQQQPRGPALVRPESAEDMEEGNHPSSSLPGKLMKRMKLLFVAAGIIGLVVGGIQLLGNKLEFGDHHTDSTQRAKTGNLETQKREQLARDIMQVPLSLGPAQPPAEVVPPLAPPSPQSVAAAKPTQSAEAAKPTQTATAAKPAQTATAAKPPSLGAPPASVTDDTITGSIAHTVTPPQRPAARLAVPDSKNLPLAIGGAKLRSAAAAGDRAAEYEVAMRFADGRRVPANLKEAAHWFERAARAGLVPAQFRYASMLEKGQGVKKDLPTARKLYGAAASKGNAKAMHNLAVLYAEGADGKPDYAKAAKWFRRAAEHGITDSQYNLGVLCARGLGTDKSFEEAYKWFALAAAKGDPESAKKRDAVASRLDPRELGAAKRAVKAFKAKAQPAAAVRVPRPHGGWDGTAAASAAPKGKAKAQPEPRPRGPLSLGSFTVGKR